MKLFLAALLMFGLIAPVYAGGVDEGVVTELDGKGSLTVKTKNNGVLKFQAGKRLLDENPATKTGGYPHCYKMLQLGDHIKMCWGHDKMLQKIAEGVRILKRAVPD